MARNAPAEASWNAICLADFGDGGVAFVAQPQIPPRNINWSLGRKMGASAPRSGSKNISCARSGKGESEPFYEKLALHALGIEKLRFD